MRTQIPLVKTELQYFKGCYSYQSDRLEYANYGVSISSDEFNGVTEWAVHIHKVVRCDSIKQGFRSFEEARAWLDEHFWLEGRDTSIDLPHYQYRDDPTYSPASDAAWARDWDAMREEVNELVSAFKQHIENEDRKKKAEQQQSKSDELCEKFGFGEFKDKLTIIMPGGAT